VKRDNETKDEWERRSKSRKVGFAREWKRRNWLISKEGGKSKKAVEETREDTFVHGLGMDRM
jgi:hypothetical protein